MDYGYSAQWGLAKSANDFARGAHEDGTPKLGVPLWGHYVFVGAGAEAPLGDITVGASGGPKVFLPARGHLDPLPGCEIRLRGSYGRETLRPYLEGFASYGRSTGSRWSGEGTRDLFGVGGTVGLSFRLEAWGIDLGYRFHHLSNGSAIFGSPEPNAGYNGDMVIVGLWKAF